MNRTKEFRTNVLFPRSSFLLGVGSVMNISGNYFGFNYSESTIDADSKAIESDWGMVGKDVELAIKKVKASTKQVDVRK